MSEESDDLPIRALAELEQTISPEFLNRVRGKIYRRTAVSHFAAFSWRLPGAILLEFVSIVSHLFSVVGGRDTGKR
jgi:hypothetical protein